MSDRRLTIRFDDSEWDVVERAAGCRPVATYAREKLLAKAASRRVPLRRPRSDEVLLARILAALASSDLPRSMRAIADGMRIGTLPDSDDILLDLRAACLALEKMRLDLIEALGVEPE